MTDTDDPQAADAPPPDFVGSVAHGLAVLRAFDHDHFQMTLSEVSARTGMTRAGARRYLLTLAYLGYVQQNGRLFRLTPKVLELGYAFMSTVPLADTAQPYLDRLTKQTGEVSAIAVMDGREVVHLAVAIPAQRQLMPKVTIGRRFNALYNSTGRVLIACDQNKTIEQQLSGAKLARITEWSMDSKVALLDELRRVREQQYAIVDQESEEGLRSLAVPIRNKQGHAVAAINIITNVATVSREELTQRLLPVLRQAADELALSLGAQPLHL
ncbi:MAG: IclR family transcriptional regulator domain-containing protein [Solimonas sp.]